MTSLSSVVRYQLPMISWQWWRQTRLSKRVARDYNRAFIGSVRRLLVLVKRMVIVMGMVVGMLAALVGCEDLLDDLEENAPSQTARVINVIDGDTIDVELNGVEYRVRYIGVNTPERDQTCYDEATAANRALVSGQSVRLVADVSDTDPYGRLLRYVYVGDVFVNARLVEQGAAEAVRYPPDDAHFDEFRALERAAAAANLLCHATGIFDDGSSTR